MYLSIFCDRFKVVIPKLGYFISLRIKLGLRNGRGKMDLRLIAGNLSANKGYHLQYPPREKVGHHHFITLLQIGQE